jgi:hypothetical protein
LNGHHDEIAFAGVRHVEGFLDVIQGVVIADDTQRIARAHLDGSA